MPREYEAIRDRLVASGKDYDESQRIAAATYNKRHPKAPISGKEYDKKKRHIREMEGIRKRRKKR